MTEIKFKADVTQFHPFQSCKGITRVSFEVHEEYMTIHLIDGNDGVIEITEIDRESAVQLAKYILFMTEQILPQ